MQPAFDAFAKTYEKGAHQIVYEKISADLDTPVSLFIKLTRDEKFGFLLESVTGGETRGRYSIIGCDPDMVWSCHGDRSYAHQLASDTRTDYADKPLEVFRALMGESRMDLPAHLPSSAAGWFGYLGYDMIRHFEHLPDINPDDINTPDAMMLRPRLVAVVDAVSGDVTLVVPVWHDPGITAQDAFEQAHGRIKSALDALEHHVPQLTRSYAQDLPETDPSEESSNFTHAGYLKAVDKCKEYIKAGDIFQVVLSQRWSQRIEYHPLAFYRALRRTNPSPYMFYFNFGEFQVAGASPEILVRVQGSEVTIRPIAGTRPRGKTEAEDIALEDDLLGDPKERAEHLMLLDLGRNDVGRVAQLCTVRPTAEFTIERYSHVMHIVSNVVGELRAGCDAIDALFAGLPAGTLSGAPKIRAMEIIDELEPQKRGIYGGGVGYFSAGGDMDMCIALRTAVIKDQTLFFQAGGGIVYDSDPQLEFEETVHKSNAIRSASRLAPVFKLSDNLY